MKKIFSFVAVIILFATCKKTKQPAPIVPALAAITTTTVSAITSSTAISGGNITSDGGATVTGRGICYSTSANPTIASSIILIGSGAGSFSANITGLAAGVTYHVRAYATNSVGTAYGNEVNFTTNTSLATITTTIVSAITSSTATSGGSIASDGGAVITERGICYNTIGNPTTVNSKVISGNGTGIFSSDMMGLAASTTYHVKAYAINSAGTVYGNEVSFTTSASLASIITTVASSIFETTAVSGGNIISNGGAPITAHGIAYSTSMNPTIANSIVTGSGTIGVFIFNLTGLTANTTYYVRAFATNMAGTAYGNQISFTTQVALPTVADCDGNIYHTITIGSQVWMLENLRTTKYRDFTPIPNITDNVTWAALTTSAYSNYNNNSTHASIYGRLYNWYAVNDSRNIAPLGWHVPSDSEWTTLITYLGVESLVGGKLKEAGLTHWLTPNTAADNSSGFTGLPGGHRRLDGTFFAIGDLGYWWSSTEYVFNNTWAWWRIMYSFDSRIDRLNFGKSLGFSVRCIKD